MIREQKLRALWLASILFFVLAHMIFFVRVARSEYPERPVTVIVAMEAGGTIDVSVRAMAPGASSALGQPLIVENKGGGGGTVALAVIATAKPDGYTLCASNCDAVVITCLMQNVPFKPLKSFTSIMGFAMSEHTALLVKSDSPWKTFKEFMDYAKKNPGKIKYSSAGIGTGMHIAMEVIAKKEGIKWVHVPYKGTAPARTALLGGHVDACSSGLGWLPFVESGALRVLATHGRERLPNYPDVPTLKELGYGFVNDTVHAVLGPAGLPPEVVKKLETAFIKGTETPEFKTAAEKLYVTPILIKSKEYDLHLKERWVRAEKMFKEIGIIKEAATQPY
jgi:tripartite-type tricarboxylate transporter receptor subunit TctC